MKLKLDNVNQLELIYTLLRQVRLGQECLYSEEAFKLLQRVEKKASEIGILEEELPVVDATFTQSEGLTLEINFPD